MDTGAPVERAGRVPQNTDPRSGRYYVQDVHHVNYAQADDRSLVNVALQGDHAAFRILMERHQRKLYSLAYGVLRNEQDALDVLQETLIKVHRNLARFEGTASFYTWVYRITTNLCIDHLRKTKRLAGEAFDEATGQGASPAPILGEMALADRGDPSALLQRREIREAVAASLDELSEKHRTVLVLRELEGMSYDEIAQSMACSKGTIMSRLFHARRNLQDKLKQRLPGVVPNAAEAESDRRIDDQPTAAQEVGAEESEESKDVAG